MTIPESERFLNLSSRLVKLNFLFYSYDSDNVFTYVNEAVTDILGYSVEEFLVDLNKHSGLGGQ